MGGLVQPRLVCCSLEDQIEEAIDFLRANLLGKGQIYVGFSGGKDSIVTAKLMELSELPHTLFYSFSGIDPPEVVRFIKQEYPHTVFMYPNKSFWHFLITHNPPTKFSRWCCTKLRKEPANKTKLKLRVLGIRAEESVRRSKYPRLNTVMTRRGNLSHTLLYPILKWTSCDVWEFIELFHLATPEPYDWGFDRLGCVVCPYHSTKDATLHKLYREYWPGYFKMFEKRVAQWYALRKRQGKIMAHESAKAFLEEWYDRSNVRWYAESLEVA